MSEFKANIVLAYNVHRQIKWFTEHLDTELGAVGTVRIRTVDGNKYFYVDKLYYPKQYVTGATVHFTGEMWKNIIQEVSTKELGKINFYWHRHPGGSPGCSSTDEDETFDTFMDDDAKRPYFIFLQTAWDNGEMKKEVRIDVRNPIRVTILNERINLFYECSPEDKELAKVCEAIKKKCIVERPISQGLSDYGKLFPGVRSYYHRGSNYNYNRSEKVILEGDVEALKKLFGNVEEERKDQRLYVDNNLIKTSDGFEFSPVENEQVSMEFKHGGCIVKTGQDFKEILKSAVRPNNFLGDVVRPKPTEKTFKDGVRTMFKLQPAPKSFNEFRKKLLQLFINYNKNLLKECCDLEKIEEENGDYDDKPLQQLIQDVNIEQPKRGFIEQSEEGDKIVVYDEPELVDTIINQLEINRDLKVVWNGAAPDCEVASIYDKENHVLGSLMLDPTWHSLEVFGAHIAEIVNRIIDEYQEQTLMDLTGVNDNGLPEEKTNLAAKFIARTDTSKTKKEGKKWRKKTKKKKKKKKKKKR